MDQEGHDIGGACVEGLKESGQVSGERTGPLFNHLHLWIKTDIMAPRTTSIVESIKRELVRRLKKIGWNWSNEGATRMGRIVMIRRYHKETWKGTGERCITFAVDAR